MLLNFSVKNYKSICDDLELSMVAGTSSSRNSNHTFETGNSIAPKALRAACILGPNASGKSSLIEAADFFRDFVVSSAKDMTEGDEINVKPFKLEKTTRKKPSEFEILFVYKKHFYQYGFSVSGKMVQEEWMHQKPSTKNTRTRQIFSRKYLSKKLGYDWSINNKLLKISSSQERLWKDSTRDNALFFSTAVNLNSEFLAEPFHWVRKFFRIITTPERLSERFSASQCKEEIKKDKILNLIQSADIAIEDIAVNEYEADFPKELEEMLRESAIEKIKKNTKSIVSLEVKTVHTDNQGNKVEFDLDEESTGTKVLFSLAGPWIDVLENGYTLIVDELHNSLHPLALRYLVGLFNSNETNPNNAQLLFSSHETSIISKDLMHKDQIWLMEKSQKGKSILTPLSSFHIRDTEAFQRSYLGGRYGALPKISGSLR